jgi:hypothetical protein
MGASVKGLKVKGEWNHDKKIWCKKCSNIFSNHFYMGITHQFKGETE